MLTNCILWDLGRRYGHFSSETVSCRRSCDWKLSLGHEMDSVLFPQLTSVYNAIVSAIRGVKNISFPGWLVQEHICVLTLQDQ